MTQRQIAALAVRILAIYAVINSFNWLMTSVAMFSQTSRTGSGITYLSALSFLPFFAFSAFGVFLWVFADALAFMMADTDEHNPIATRLGPVEILTLSFCIAGLWFAFTSLPQLAGTIVVSLSKSFSNSPGLSGGNSLTVEFILTAAQVAIGLGVFFGARKLADKIATRYQLSPSVEADLS